MRIVRKVDPEGDEAEFCVGDDGWVRHRWVRVGRVEMEAHPWWVTSATQAESFGSTLSALHHELMEAGDAKA